MQLSVIGDRQVAFAAGTVCEKLGSVRRRHEGSVERTLYYKVTASSGPRAMDHPAIDAKPGVTGLLSRVAAAPTAV
jgi:hypothetical protein